MADPAAELFAGSYGGQSGFPGGAQQLDDAHRVAGLGSWEWDLITGRVSWSDQLYRLFGLDPQSREGGLEAFLALLDSDERVEAERAIREAVDDGCLFAFDQRFRLPNFCLSDGRVCPTQGSGNLALTVMALASRLGTQLAGEPVATVAATATR